jgi:cellulose synthase/poly-beta-1,6-N-acetylglucosamine synthase-like glycosyltransferase
MVIDLEKVSIIVPVFNSEKAVKKCIKSLLNIDYPKKNLEIILVDDGSSDATKDVIKSYKGVKLIKQNHEGPAAARNNGFRNSNGKYIFFTDSDCIVSKDWIKKMVGEFRDDIAIVGGSLVPFSFKKKSERFEQDRRERLYGEKREFINFLPACNMAIRRGVFERINGFDESFRYPSFEDYDLCYRTRKMGCKILYDPKIGVIHLHSLTWKGVFRRAFMHGREGVKFRNKLGYPIIKEILSSLKVFLLPITAIKNYPKKFILVGMIYDFINILGVIFGTWVNK